MNNPIKKFISIAVILLLLAGGFFYFINSEKNSTAVNKNQIPRVNIVQITPNLKPITLNLPSSAQAFHITPIWSRVSGYLLRYLVDIGDIVKEGDLLAELDTPETDKQVLQAKAELSNSIAQRDIAKVTADRWQSLWQKNEEAVSKQEVDQYAANYLAAQATVLANEKNLGRLRVEQKFKYIYAPFSGIITQRNIDIGSLVLGNTNGAPQELFQIAEDKTIRFFIDVPQTYFRVIKTGIKTNVKIEQFPDKVFEGKITRFAKALDPIARTLLTQVDINNEDGLIYPGVFASVTFLIEPDTINFIIPTTAIIIREGFPHVATINEQNIVLLKRVQIGRNYGREMEITDGLQDKDRLIKIPSDQIVNGVKVEVI